MNPVQHIQCIRAGQMLPFSSGHLWSPVASIFDPDQVPDPSCCLLAWLQVSQATKMDSVLFCSFKRAKVILSSTCFVGFQADSSGFQVVSRLIPVVCWWFLDCFYLHGPVPFKAVR